MHYTLAHIFRRDDIDREQFRTHYEQHHTYLARRTLPEFSHYRRNHVIATTAPALCPDSFSEFGFADEEQVTATRAILADRRGRALLDDELTFMNKPRNRIFLIARDDVDSADTDYKYIVVVQGSAAAAKLWLTALADVDAGLRKASICSELGIGDEQQTHWLMAWSEVEPDLSALEQRLRGLAVPVQWSAAVSEHRGYPA